MNHSAESVAATWVPVRYIHREQRCVFCQNRIPRGAPGSSKGTRGTKAWRNSLTGDWECIPCRTEGFKVDAARRELTERAGVTNLRSGESS